MNKAIFTSIGFLLFMVGFCALCLSLVGIKLSYLTWIDIPGPLFGFVVRLIMIIGGVVIVVLAQTDWKQEENEA